MRAGLYFVLGAIGVRGGGELLYVCCARNVGLWARAFAGLFPNSLCMVPGFDFSFLKQKSNA